MKENCITLLLLDAECATPCVPTEIYSCSGFRLIPRPPPPPVFRHSSPSVYYTEYKPKNKMGKAWERG